MGRYEEIDLSRVTGISIGDRHSKVAEGMLASPPLDPDSFGAFWDGLPGTLGAAELRGLARAIARARAAAKPVVWMCGAHVIKVGLGPVLIRLLREDLATLLAVNGAFVIHDLELALWGQTSEDVGAELHQGRFGMARETAAVLNAAISDGARRGEGFGEAVGRVLLERRDAWVAHSVIGTCYELGVPATVHVAIGTDINHQHPDFRPEAAGETSGRDFRILAGHLRDLDGAVVVNVGSAVVLPEVLLKALSVATNLGGSCRGMVTATLDFQRHYRPQVNVVERPTAAGGHGSYLVGHHEILLPLLYQGVLLERGRLQRGEKKAH
jgi:hypothetical protein